MLVIINDCYGGYGISAEAAIWLYDKGFREEGFLTPIDEYYGSQVEEAPLGRKKCLEDWREYLKTKARSLFLTYFTPGEDAVMSSRPNSRKHPLLIQCIQELGEKANGTHASLKIVEIPDGTDYTIEEYDGAEHIAEKHKTWG